MAIVNSLGGGGGKDSSWLQLEVCREYQRNKCSRPDTECKFAHPPSTVEVQGGRVIACYDSIKGRCNREKPPCKYFHPPQHLKDQLLINGRNHLALKQALMQTAAVAQTGFPPHLTPAHLIAAAAAAGASTGQLPTVAGHPTPTVPPTTPSAATAASILAAAFNSAATSGPTRMHHVTRLQRRKEVECRVTNSPAGLAVDTYAALRKQAASNPYVAASLSPAGLAAAYGTYPFTLIPGLMSAADHLTNAAAYGISPLPATPNHATLLNHSTTNKSPQRTDRLEVCREFKRGNCKRPDADCRYAHPPDHVQVDSNDGLVTVCMDFIKGRCSRDTCRYMHPPPHLQAQLKARSNSNASAGVGGSGVAGIGNHLQQDGSNHSMIPSPVLSTQAPPPPNQPQLLSLTALPHHHPLTLAAAAAAASSASRPYRL